MDALTIFHLQSNWIFQFHHHAQNPDSQVGYYIHTNEKAPRRVLFVEIFEYSVYYSRFYPATLILKRDFHNGRHRQGGWNSKSCSLRCSSFGVNALAGHRRVSCGCGKQDAHNKEPRQCRNQAEITQRGETVAVHGKPENQHGDIPLFQLHGAKFDLHCLSNNEGCHRQPQNREDDTGKPIVGDSVQSEGGQTSHGGHEDRADGNEKHSDGLLFPFGGLDLLALELCQEHHRRGFKHIAQEVYPDHAEEGVLGDLGVDGIAHPHPETAVQTDGNNVQQNVHGHDKEACRKSGHPLAEMQFFRKVDAVHGEAAPHKSAEQRELLRHRSQAQPEAVVVIIDVRHSHRHKLHKEADKCRRAKGEQGIVVFFMDEVYQHDCHDDVAHQLKRVYPAHNITRIRLQLGRRIENI